MYKVLATIFLFSILFSACGSPKTANFPEIAPTSLSTQTDSPLPTATLTKTPRPTITPKPSPTPCPEIIEPVILNKISLYYYCGATQKDQELINEYIEYANNDSPVTIEAEIHVYMNIDEFVQDKYEYVRAHHYGDTLDDVRRSIGEGGGETGSGLGWWYIGGKWWKQWTQPSERQEFVFHEYHHLIQTSLNNGRPTNNKFAWLTEGGATFFAQEQLLAQNIKPTERQDVLTECDYTLEQLSNFNDAPNIGCIYGEGKYAVRLLVTYWGKDKYYDLWRSLGVNTLSVAMKKTYGITLGNFYTLFSEYQSTDFKAIPVFVTPTP